MIEWLYRRLGWVSARSGATEGLADQMSRLGFALLPGRRPPSEELVRAFEARFGLDLPADYRAFLVRHGGVRGQASCALLEPAPSGSTTTIEGFFGFERDEIGEMTLVTEGAPEFIALGTEPLSRMFLLCCARPYRGHVFLSDHYGRSAWTDDQFLLQFPDPHPDIRHYLDLRRAGRLPAKPPGFENLYLVARGFTDFIERLRPRESVT